MTYRIIEIVPQHLSTIGAQKAIITYIPKLYKDRLPKSLTPLQEPEGEENLTYNNDGKGHAGHSKI